MNPPRTRVLLVSGLSGAGKSSALKLLEDHGYEAVDNVPLSLLPRLTRTEGDAGELPPGRALAVGIDSRTRGFSQEAFEATLRVLRARPDLEVIFLYLDCDDDELLSRYTETRRRHPLAADRPVADGIAHERQLLRRLRDTADRVIDTTELPLPELRRILDDSFSLEGEPGLTITLTSFSYRRGLPRQADLVFDVRFLRNPHYVDTLRPLTGQRPEVGAYIAADPAFEPFIGKLSELLLLLLPHYSREGKSYLTIAIGCTGGRHRSVYVSACLGDRLREEGYRATVRHRDIDLGGTT